MSVERRKEIGELIRIRREQAEMSQTDLANRMGLSRQQIGHYEAGRSEITVVDLERISEILEVPITYFFQKDVDYANDPEPVFARYKHLPPQYRRPIDAMIDAAHQEVKRSETTHGRKAE